MSLIDYSNSVIYQVVPKNKELEYRYIGGTTNFKMRKSISINQIVKCLKTIKITILKCIKQSANTRWV